MDGVLAMNHDLTLRLIGKRLPVEKLLAELNAETPTPLSKRMQRESLIQAAHDRVLGRLIVAGLLE